MIPPPLRLPTEITDPLRSLGKQLAAATGINVFAGPYGWLLTGLLLLGLTMVILALSLGYRREHASSSP